MDEEFDAKVEDIAGLYISAIERYQNGERTISIDEMTGIQATERLEKDLPMRPGKVARREFEYIRHGTQSLIASFDVATGQIVERTAQQHFQEVFTSEPLPADPAEQLRLLAPKSLSPENLDPMRMNFYRLIVAESGRFPHLAELYVEQFEKPNLETCTRYLQEVTQLRSSDPEAVAWIIEGMLLYYYLVMETLHGKNVMTMTLERIVEAMIELLFSDRK